MKMVLVLQFLIEVATAEGPQTGLRADSVVQCGNLATYSQDRIIRVMGRLAMSHVDQLDECLLVALDCDDFHSFREMIGQ